MIGCRTSLEGGGIDCAYPRMDGDGWVVVGGGGRGGEALCGSRGEKVKSEQNK